jgi:hypothetical protein
MVCVGLRTLVCERQRNPIKSLQADTKIDESPPNLKVIVSSIVQYIVNSKQPQDNQMFRNHN